MGSVFIAIGSKFDQFVLGYAERVYPTDLDTCLSDRGPFINNATMTYELKDSNGVAVPNGSGNLNYIPNSSGNYVGIIPASVTATLTNGAKYTIVVKMYENNVLMDTVQPQYVARIDRGKEGCC